MVAVLKEIVRVRVFAFTPGLRAVSGQVAAGVRTLAPAVPNVPRLTWVNAVIRRWGEAANTIGENLYVGRIQHHDP